MTMQELLDFETIVIQCHNNPDADAIASGWAVQRWLERQGKSARLIYGGPDAIQKANLRLMVKELGIAIEHVQDLNPPPDLLLCVDGTYKSDKVQTFAAQTVAVIDHHKVTAKDAPNLPALREIRDSCGSCSTIVWDLLREAGMTEVTEKKDKKLLTALYYGLFMDTNRLEELPDPLDKEMRSELESNCLENILNKLKYNNLSPKELRIVGRALSSSRYDLVNRYSLAEAEPCDPNILGIISDQILEVENTDVCVVYCMQKDGAKISVRSCTWQVPANVLASALTDGRGGGHEDKAGGTLSKVLYHAEGEDEDMDSERAFWCLWERLKQYFKRQSGSLKVQAKAVLSQNEGNVLAWADITLGGCLTVKKLCVFCAKEDKQKIFVGMPGAKDSSGQYYDVCFPVTAQMRKAIQDAVLHAYHRALEEAGDAPANAETDSASGDELELTVKVYPLTDAGSLLAFASVRLGNCFVVKDICVRTGKFGVFAAMPSWKDSKGKYQEICVPATPEMKKRLQEAVLKEYHNVMDQQ